MSWLATWFICDMIEMGTAPHLNELQAFKNVSLEMMINKKTSTFRRIFHKNLQHIQV